MHPSIPFSCASHKISSWCGKRIYNYRKIQFYKTYCLNGQHIKDHYFCHDYHHFSNKCIIRNLISLFSVFARSVNTNIKPKIYKKTQILNSNKVNHLTTQSLTDETNWKKNIKLIQWSFPYFYGVCLNHQKSCLFTKFLLNLLRQIYATLAFSFTVVLLRIWNFYINLFLLWVFWHLEKIGILFSVWYTFISVYNNKSVRVIRINVSFLEFTFRNTQFSPFNLWGYKQKPTLPKSHRNKNKGR